MVVGFTGGSIPEVKVNRLLLNNTEVVGAGWGAYVMPKPDLNREIGAAVNRIVDDGFVRPIVGARFRAGAGGRRAEADRRAGSDRQGRPRVQLSASASGSVMKTRRRAIFPFFTSTRWNTLPISVWRASVPSSHIIVTSTASPFGMKPRNST